MPVWIYRERGQSKTVKRAGHLSRTERQAFVMVSLVWLHDGGIGSGEEGPIESSYIPLSRWHSEKESRVPTH